MGVTARRLARRHSSPRTLVGGYRRSLGRTKSPPVPTHSHVTLLLNPSHFFVWNVKIFFFLLDGQILFGRICWILHLCLRRLYYWWLFQKRTAFIDSQDCLRTEDSSKSLSFEIGSLWNLNTMPRELKKRDSSSTVKMKGWTCRGLFAGGKGRAGQGGNVSEVAVEGERWAGLPVASTRLFPANLT